MWQKIKTIVSPSREMKAVHSAEPFVFDGKSYLSFLALKPVPLDSPKRKLNAEVWIASVDPEENFLRKVSGSTEIYRSDPETVVTDETVFIYYTELLNEGHLQRRARTGMVRD